MTRLSSDGCTRGRRIAAAAVRALALLSFALLTHTTDEASAQLVSLRSLPVASGDQFLVYPAQRLGMAGASITLRDPWLDPFVNPAKGSLLTESAVLASPTIYGISEGNGGGRTLPLTGLFTGGAMFGGVSLAIQQIENREADDTFGRPCCCCFVDDARRLDESAARNLFLHALVGRRLGSSGLSVGGGLSYASLGAVDGVDLLYQGSAGIDQSGHVLDARVGLFGSDDRGRSYELLLLHRDFDMRHDVRFVDWLWTRDVWQAERFERVQIEHDKTRTWGVHAGYDAPIAEAGWRIGGVFTMNRKDHPKIPNYQIQNIPRDPGDTWGFDMGAGLSRAEGPVTAALDVVFEPIWSETWSVLDTAVAVPGGGKLQAGAKEVENEFFFSNVHVRVGVERETERWGAQLGVTASSYAYDLDQFNNVTRIRRRQDEAWMEWTPSWGGSLRLPEVEVRYSGRMTTGTGRPGVAWGWPTVGRGMPTINSADFIVAPSGPLTLQDVRVLTHQVAVRLPIH